MSSVLMGEVLSQNRAMRNSAQNLATFPGEGLIPRPDLYYAILDGGKTNFYPNQEIVIGKVLDFLQDLTAENVFSRQKIKIIPKPIMGYELSKEKTEMEILKSAHRLGLTRHKVDFFGKETFFDYPDFHNMNLGREMEINLYDFYQVALRHKLPKENSGKRLPKNKKIHFFLEVPILGQNKFERVLKTFHILLQNKEDLSLEATAHAFIPNHKWNKGDLCFFMIHKNFIPNIENI